MKNIMIVLIIGILLVGVVSAGLISISTLDTSELDSKELITLTEQKITELKTTDIFCDKLCSNKLQMERNKKKIDMNIYVIPLKKEAVGKGWKITKLTEEEIKAKQEEKAISRLKILLGGWSKLK